MNATVLDPSTWCNAPAIFLPLHPDSSSVDHHALQQVAVTEPRLVQSLAKITLQHFDWISLISTLALCTTVYVGCLVIYRLYLTPVAAVPGPFWAKVSSWYEFYYDYLHVGKYYEKIHEMHEKYGRPSFFHLTSDAAMMPARSILLTNVERPHCARHARRSSHPRSLNVPPTFRISSSAQNRWVWQVLGRDRFRRHDKLRPPTSLYNKTYAEVRVLLPSSS